MRDATTILPSRIRPKIIIIIWWSFLLQKPLQNTVYFLACQTSIVHGLVDYACFPMSLFPQAYLDASRQCKQLLCTSSSFHLKSIFSPLLIRQNGGKGMIFDDNSVIPFIKPRKKSECCPGVSLIVKRWIHQAEYVFMKKKEVPVWI